MLLPDPLRTYRDDCRRLAHWPVGRAVQGALAELLEPWAAPAAGLRYDVIWCRSTDACAALLAGDSGCTHEQARQFAPFQPALYWPGYGVFVNGPELSGAEGAQFAEGLLDAEDTRRLLRLVLHEQAGHGFVMHHTRLGLAQMRDSTWREAARATPPEWSRVPELEARMRRLGAGCLLTVEGFSEWVADRLLPEVCARLEIAPEPRRTPPDLPEDLAEAREAPLSADDTQDLLTALDVPKRAYDLGHAAFGALEETWGDVACAAATAIACGERSPDALADRPDVRLLQMLGLRGDPGPAGLAAAARNEFGWNVPVEWRATHRT